MKTFFQFTVTIVLAIVVCGSNTAYAQDAAQEDKSITLPAPRMEGGMPLMEALQKRHSSRGFDGKMLPPQVMSDLLWAAFGINRPETGKRTAPSAMNWQELDIYAVTADGVFVYEAVKNRLNRISGEDLRELTGQQPFVKTAPVNLVFVSDYAKMKGDDDGKRMLSGSHAGFVSQNIYLYCASEGLATVVRAMADRDALSKAIGLRPEQRITLLQTVGYPKSEAPAK